MAQVVGGGVEVALEEVESDGGFDGAEAEDGEGAVIVEGVGGVSHGAAEEIDGLELIAELFLEGLESGGEGGGGGGGGDLQKKLVF